MLTVKETSQFTTWFKSLKDRSVRSRISIRIRRLSLGNPGVAKSVGEGVSELKFDFGPGYRVYFTYQGTELVFLLGGGDKSTQAADIDAAKKLAKELKDSDE